MTVPKAQAKNFPSLGDVSGMLGESSYPVGRLRGGGGMVLRKSGQCRKLEVTARLSLCALSWYCDIKNAKVEGWLFRGSILIALVQASA
jgi:hypothetical protein